jgi:flagellar biosynthesis protein FlhB
LERDKVPRPIDALQVACIALYLATLALTVNSFLVVVNLVKMLLAFLILFRMILSPCGVVWPTYRLDIQYDTSDCFNVRTFISHTRRLALFATLYIVAFFVLYAFVFAETFSSTLQVYRQAQLRVVNDAMHPFNRPLLFHNWTQQAQRQLAQNKLPFERVILVVVDGLRHGKQNKNTCFFFSSPNV